MNRRVLNTILRVLAVILILRVLVVIVSNYPDYFPPNFDSLFLQGREATFNGIYPTAFYIHIFSAPFVLVAGLVLLSDYVRVHYRAVHRWLGRVHVAVLLTLVLPSSVVMARHAFGGWAAGVNFLVLSCATALCAILGVVYARRRDYARHRRWMWRCYVLICSAVVLRLLSGAADLAGASDAELAYVIAAWASWLVPLATLEVATALASSRMRF